MELTIGPSSGAIGANAAGKAIDKLDLRRFGAGLGGSISNILGAGAASGGVDIGSIITQIVGGDGVCWRLSVPCAT